MLPSASRNALHRFAFVTIAAVVWLYLSSIAALISSTGVLKSSTNADLTVQTWDLFEQVQNGLGAVSSWANLLPDVDWSDDR